MTGKRATPLAVLSHVGIEEAVKDSWQAMYAFRADSEQARIGSS